MFSSVCGADVDDDGYDDLLISSPHADTAGTSSGEADLIFGLGLSQ